MASSPLLVVKMHQRHGRFQLDFFIGRSEVLLQGTRCPAICPAAPKARIAATTTACSESPSKGTRKTSWAGSGWAARYSQARRRTSAGGLPQGRSGHPHRRFTVAGAHGVQGAEPDGRIGLAGRQRAQAGHGKTAQRLLAGRRHELFRRPPPLIDVLVVQRSKAANTALCRGKTSR